jgi:predicted transcriptional regulator
MSNLSVTLSEDILKSAQEMAAQEHLSLEEFASRALADVISSRAAMDAYIERGKKVSRERIREILNKVPDVPPMPGDEMP